jgi:D-alanine--poly(phosphoribitol) ligase subunit 2
MPDQQEIRQRVLRVLSDVTNSRDVLTRTNLPLYESGLLDSLGTVNLILALGEEFGVEISPSEFDATAWATPDAVVADMSRRLGAPAGAG